MAFREVLYKGFYSIATDGTRRMAMRLAAAIVPSSVVAAILSKGASLRSTEYLLETILARRKLMRNRSFAYHVMLCPNL
jgi:hypothetical protein